MFYNFADVVNDRIICHNLHIIMNVFILNTKNIF